MDTSLTVKQLRRQSWTLMLREQAASGLSVRDWCQQNNISNKTFYYRRRQVQTMVLQSADESRFAELIMPEPPVKDADLPRSDPGYNGFTPQLTISIGNIMIGVTQNTPQHLLSDVLQVIRNA